MESCHDPLRANLLLALVWLVITGGFSLANLISASFSERPRSISSASRSGQGIFPALAQGRLAHPVPDLRPRGFGLEGRLRGDAAELDLKPGVFLYRHKMRSEFEIALLSNLVGLTPETLIFDIADDERTLYVHALDCFRPGRPPTEISRASSAGFLELSQ